MIERSKKAGPPGEERRARRGAARNGKEPAAPARDASAAAEAGHRWTFLSNHAHVLICLVQDPEARVRDLAERAGITERSVQNILADLEGEGLVERFREGRRNTYALHLDRPLRHPIEQHRDVEELVALFVQNRS